MWELLGKIGNIKKVGNIGKSRTLKEKEKNWIIRKIWIFYILLVLL